MDAEFDLCDEIKQYYSSDLLYPGQDWKFYHKILENNAILMHTS